VAYLSAVTYHKRDIKSTFYAHAGGVTAAVATEVLEVSCC
jgi:hypothetical protein